MYIKRLAGVAVNSQCSNAQKNGNFSKGLMCLSTSGYYTQVENSYREQLRKIHQLGPPAGIEPTPVRCRRTALIIYPQLKQVYA